MIHPRQAISILAVLSTLSLTGCVGLSEPPAQPPAQANTPSTSSAPQSQEELLTESLKVINSYNSTLIQILSDHSADASLLSPYATAAAVDEVRADQDDMTQRGRRLAGSQSILNAVLQEADATGSHITVLTCEEYGQVRVIENGVDVTTPNRTSRSTMRVSLTRQSGRWLVERSVVWDGSSIC